MKYELPSTELIVIEENNYLKFGEYLNDMQCDDTANKLSLDDLEYVKKLQQENKKYKEVIFKIKMIIYARIKEYQKKIDNEIDMGSQGDHFKICRYEENIKFLKDILKEVK